MNLEEIIKKRRSVRNFKETDVSDKTLRYAINLARHCPSAGAIRGFEAIITREKLSVNVAAPVYLVICTDTEKYAPRYGERGTNLYAVQDATIFAAYIQLILVSIGLASCWIGAFREEKIKNILKTDHRPVVIIAVGHPRSVISHEK